jgi:Trp operon repressor
MLSLLTHFNDLLSHEPGQDKAYLSDEWTQYVAICCQSFNYSTLRTFNNLIDSNHESSLTTITETWNTSDLRRDSVLGRFPTDSVISKLAESVQPVEASSSCSLSCRKNKSTSVGQSLLQILSSKRTNDEISMELAELLGFDELELVAEILADRIGIYTEVLFQATI